MCSALSEGDARQTLIPIIGTETAPLPLNVAMIWARQTLIPIIGTETQPCLMDRSVKLFSPNTNPDHRD